MTPYPNRCIHHEGEGLCPDCAREAEEDPGAWTEYGNHPQGIANWEALQREIAAQPTVEPWPNDDQDIPF